MGINFVFILVVKKNAWLVVVCNVKHCTYIVGGHSISTRNFQDLNTSIDDIHNLLLINTEGRMLNFHMQSSCLGVDMWARKFDTILLMWIPFWISKQVWLSFTKAKDLVPFHVCDFSCERWVRCMFPNRVYKLLMVIRLGFFTQRKLIFIKPLTQWNILLKMVVQCCLFDNSNIRLSKVVVYK